MSEANDHFRTVEGWREAESAIGFTPLRPKERPKTFRIHVKDHRKRDVPPTLEVYFDGYVLSQAKRGEAEANRLVARTYGPDPIETWVSGHKGVMHELGPEPEENDIDSRQPAVVTWADGPLFFLIASDTRSAADLMAVAVSLYY